MMEGPKHGAKQPVQMQLQVQTLFSFFQFFQKALLAHRRFTVVYEGATLVANHLKSVLYRLVTTADPIRGPTLGLENAGSPQ